MIIVTLIGLTISINLNLVKINYDGCTVPEQKGWALYLIGEDKTSYNLFHILSMYPLKTSHTLIVWTMTIKVKFSQNKGCVRLLYMKKRDGHILNR